MLERVRQGACVLPSNCVKEEGMEWVCKGRGACGRKSTRDREVGMEDDRTEKVRQLWIGEGGTRWDATSP